MRRFICIFTVLFFALLSASCSQFGLGRYHSATTRPVPVADLAHYDDYPVGVKKMIARALLLSRQDLTYRFGSDNPKNGGMDCSGVIYYILKGLHPHAYAPRDSYDMYIWLLRAKKIHHVRTRYFNSSQFNALKPGDLLFWTGTYRTRHRPPITHVMLYLGKDKHHVPLMFGSSGGGIYRGREMWGVSVFDFILPSGRGRERFVGYGCIPSVTC